MSAAADDAVDAAKLKEFLAKRGEKMLKMAAELGGGEEASSPASPAGELPSLQQVLELIDALGIDPEDRLKLRERILNRAAGDPEFGADVDRVIEAAGSGQTYDGLGVLADYDLVVFGVVATVVLSVFGKRQVANAAVDLCSALLMMWS